MSKQKLTFWNHWLCICQNFTLQVLHIGAKNKSVQYIAHFNIKKKLGNIFFKFWFYRTMSTQTTSIEPLKNAQKNRFTTEQHTSKWLHRIQANAYVIVFHTGHSCTTVLTVYVCTVIAKWCLNSSVIWPETQFISLNFDLLGLYFLWFHVC